MALQAPVNALIAFDHYNEDRNGIVLRSVYDAIIDKIPVFCERRLLKGQNSDPEKDANHRHARIKIQEMLRSNEAPFNVFADIQSNEQLFIAPKEEVNSYNDLSKFGINCWKVTWISPSELLNTQGNFRPSIRNFFNLFDPHTTIHYRFIVTGHGTRDLGIAGLDIKNYADFLHSLQYLNTDAVYIQSCNAGGINKLYNPPTNFPVILESIGEFITHFYDFRYTDLFGSISKALSLGITHEIAASAFRSATWIQHFGNLRQLRLPNRSNFHPLNEDNSALVLHANNAKTPSPIAPKEIRLVVMMVHKIAAPIFLGSSKPVFTSLSKHNRPIHIFESVNTALDIIALFYQTLNTFRKENVGDHTQLIFIRNLKSESDSCQNVLVYCSKETQEISFYNETFDKYTHLQQGSSGPFKSYLKSKENFFKILRTTLPNNLHYEIIN